MNTPILFGTFATCVLGGVSVTNKIADPDSSRWTEAAKVLEVETVEQAPVQIEVEPEPRKGIFPAPKEEILPPGVTRTK
jgi:hypothetical protein